MFAVSPPSKMHSEERLTLLVTGNKAELCGQSSVQLLRWRTDSKVSIGKAEVILSTGEIVEILK